MQSVIKELSYLLKTHKEELARQFETSAYHQKAQREATVATIALEKEIEQLEAAIAKLKGQSNDG